MGSVSLVYGAYWRKVREGKMATILSEIDELTKDLPAGAWVALSEEKHQVVSFGDDPVSVMEEAQALGEKLPLMIRVPMERGMLMFFLGCQS